MLSEQELGNYEEIEARRLAEALDALDAGGEPDLDPREDPELSLLVGLGRAMREDAEATTVGHGFRSYRHRSRAFVLHTLESEGVVRAAPAAVLPFRRRVLSFAPIATAAAAALFAVAVLVGGGDGDAGGLVATRAGEADGALAAAIGGDSTGNRTAQLAGEELGRIRAALTEVDQSVNSGTPVSESVLRQITASTTALAKEIEANPGELDETTVAEYVLAADTSREALSRVPVAPGAESALAAARAAAEDGVVAATRYFQDTDDASEPGANTADGEPEVADGKDSLPVIEADKPLPGDASGGTAGSGETADPADPPAPTGEGGNTGGTGSSTPSSTKPGGTKPSGTAPSGGTPGGGSGR